MMNAPPKIIVEQKANAERAKNLKTKEHIISTETLQIIHQLEGNWCVASIGNSCAYKFTRAWNKQDLQFCAQEVKIMEKFRGAENIVQLYDCAIVIGAEEDEDPGLQAARTRSEREFGSVHCVMELADGDLRSYIEDKIADAELERKGLLLSKSGSLKTDHHLFRNRKNRSVAGVLADWKQIVGAVATCHSKGVVHFDLKPENFLRCGSRIKLTDFGLSNPIASHRTHVSRRGHAGTPRYMAPETIHQTGEIGYSDKLVRHKNRLDRREMMLKCKFKRKINGAVCLLQRNPEMSCLELNIVPRFRVEFPV